MNREQAFEAVKLRLEIPEHVIHSLAVEAVMRELAAYLHDDVDQWGIAGLVHEIDIERINNNTKLQGIVAGDILEGLDFDETIIYAVRSQNPENKISRRRRLDKALYFICPLCRLIEACVKSVPGGDLGKIDRNKVILNFNQPDFAPDIPREQIASCIELDMSVDLLVEISLKALKEAGIDLR